jgi:hypothetical protein
MALFILVTLVARHAEIVEPKVLEELVNVIFQGLNS